MSTQAQTTNLTETTLTPDLTYARLASDAQLERAAHALKLNGFNVLVAENAADAKAKLAEVIPAGAEVFTSSSTTFIQLGLFAEIDREGGRYDSVRVKLGKMDPKTQNREMQKLGATPDYIVGSVHAVTETGSLLIASATGSQLAPYAASAAHVVWIVGTQKIVPNMDDAFNRLEQYTFPLEDQRAQKAYGVHSSISKVLIYNKEFVPGRATLIFVKENLGF